MSEKKEIGTIGQMYENRQNGKLGTILERNEKYRTFLMEAPDGTTFNISYGSLKSNWRKATQEISDAVVDETKVVDESDNKFVTFEVDDVVAEVEPVVEKESKLASLIFRDTQVLLTEYIKSFGEIGNSVLSITPYTSRRKFAFKVGNHILFELHIKSRINGYKVAMKESTYNEVAWNPVLGILPMDVSYREDYIMNTWFKTSSSNIQQVLDDFRPVVIKTINTLTCKED